MDDYENFNGYMSNYLVVIEKDKDEWKSSVTFVQGRLPVGGKWENRKVEFVSVHKDPSVSAGDLLLTFTKYLESCDGNLFDVPKGEVNGKTDSNEIAQ